MILQNTAQMVRPGGVLVYVICSFTLEEGQEQVDSFLSSEEGAAFSSIELPPPPVSSWARKESWCTFDASAVKAPADCFFVAAFKRDD